VKRRGNEGGRRKMEAKLRGEGGGRRRGEDSEPSGKSEKGMT